MGPIHHGGAATGRQRSPRALSAEPQRVDEGVSVRCFLSVAVLRVGLSFFIVGSFFLLSHLPILVSFFFSISALSFSLRPPSLSAFFPSLSPLHLFFPLLVVFPFISYSNECERARVYF